MYPNLYYAFKDIFGVEWNGLKIVNSFGFFVALSFLAAAWVLTSELKRKQKQGLFTYTEQTITIGAPATFTELFINFLLGFLLGYKIIGAFTIPSALDDPQAFILSSNGNLLLGALFGLLFLGIKWWEKNKEKLDKPEQRIIRIWPHDRVGDFVIYAAIFGFTGAKIFHNLENIDDFVKHPWESLISFSGLTFYGGLICATIAIVWYARKHKIPVPHLADAIAPGLMIAYALGRVGCQIAGDGDWGIVNSAYITDATGHSIAATTEQFNNALQLNHVFYIKQMHYDSLEAVHRLPLKGFAGLPNWMFAYSYPHNVVNEGVGFAGCQGQYCSYLPLPVFPTPFYETVTCLILFSILMLFRKRMKSAWLMTGVYLVFNGVERFFIEKIRVNTTYNNLPFQPTQAEIISILLVFVGIFFIWKSRKIANKV